MNRTIIIYSSRYGTTKQYAQWLSEMLHGDLFELKNVKLKHLSCYDTIILGSALYAGSIKGIKLFNKYFETIKNKKLIIFTCGLADYTKTANIEKIYDRIAKAVPNNILEHIKIFYLRGGINYKKLSKLHKIMMDMLRKMILKNGIETIDEEGKTFLETYGKEINFTDKNTILPIIEYCGYKAGS